MAMETDFGTLEFETIEEHEKKRRYKSYWRNFRLVALVCGCVFTLGWGFTMYQYWRMNQEQHLKLFNEIVRELSPKLRFLNDDLSTIHSFTEKVEVLNNKMDGLSDRLKLVGALLSAFDINQIKEQQLSIAKLLEELNTNTSHQHFNLQSDEKIVLLQKQLDEQSKELKLSDNKTAALDDQMKEQNLFSEKRITEPRENTSQLIP